MTASRLITTLILCSAATWPGLVVALLLGRSEIAVGTLQLTCPVAFLAVLAWIWALMGPAMRQKRALARARR